MPQSPPDIEDTASAYGTPGTAGAVVKAGIPDTRIPIRAGASREYVAGSRLQWMQDIPRALTWAYDDLQVSFGDDIFERMMLDAQVRSVVNVLKTGILESGVGVAPAVTDRDDPDYAQATDLADQAMRMFSDLPMSLDDFLWDMLDALPLGHKMAEQVYGLDTTYTGKSEYTLQNLAVKPRETTAFVVDAYMNVLGILGLIPGQPFNVQQGMLLTGLNETTNLLPRAKFAILTFRPKNNDPRGQSILRPAFDPWNAKTQIKREYLSYLAQFATPSLVGFTAPMALPHQQVNADGTLAVDTNDNPIYTSPEQDMVTALQAFANGTAAAFPNGASVQAILNAGNGEAFREAFTLYDMQITKAVLNQTLATEEGQHQSKAASSTHKDTLDAIVRQGKRPACRMLERDVLRVWMQLNGMSNILHLCPVVTIGPTAQEDTAKLMAAVAQLQGTGYLHPSQFGGIDAQLGLPPRNPEDATEIPTKEVITVQEQEPTQGSPSGVPGVPQDA